MMMFNCHKMRASCYSIHFPLGKISFLWPFLLSFLTPYESVSCFFVLFKKDLDHMPQTSETSSPVSLGLFKRALWIFQLKSVKVIVMCALDDSKIHDLLNWTKKYEWSEIFVNSPLSLIPKISYIHCLGKYLMRPFENCSYLLYNDQSQNLGWELKSPSANYMNQKYQ